MLFIVAGVSDAVDGFLARTFNLRSTLGTYLDPLADKALLVSIYISLAVLEEVPLWVVILVVSRDLFIVGAVVLSWMLDQPMEMRPLIISKLNTVVQIVLAAVVLGDLALGADLGTLRTLLVYLVGFLTVASAAVYLVDWVRHMGMGDSAAGSPDGPQRRALAAMSRQTRITLFWLGALAVARPGAVRLPRHPAALRRRRGVGLCARPGRQLAGEARDQSHDRGARHRGGHRSSCSSPFSSSSCRWCSTSSSISSSNCRVDRAACRRCSVRGWKATGRAISASTRKPCVPRSPASSPTAPPSSRQ